MCISDSLHCFSISFYLPAIPNNPMYGNQASHPGFDMSKDSMPLRYDSPMSPYASYYVYVPMNGVNTPSHPMVTVDEDIPNDGRRENAVPTEQEQDTE